jgi:hypothetical protein
MNIPMVIRKNSTIGHTAIYVADEHPFVLDGKITLAVLILN